jgi:fucose permease
VPDSTDPARGGPTGTRRAYLDLIVVGYLLYGVGAVSPYLRDHLHLSDAETGLHSSALALGIVTAGLVTDRLDARWGTRLVQAAAIVLSAAACVMLAWAPAAMVTLAAAGVVGLGCGVMLGHANATLATGGGPASRVRLGRGNLVAMLAALAVPFVISGAVGIGVGWQAAFGPSLLLLGGALESARQGVDRVHQAHAGTLRRLPAAFWLAWLLVVLVVSVEFSVVFWGATLVERRASSPLTEATLAGAAFFAGMIAGRTVISLQAGGRRDPRGLLRLGLIGAFAGSVLTWASTAVPVSALGLFLCGLGVAVLYPLGTSITLGVPDIEPSSAAARLTLASGTAILIAPFLLGVLSDAVGVVVGWALVPLTCVAALVLTLVVAGERPGPVT